MLGEMITSTKMHPSCFNMADMCFDLRTATAMFGSKPTPFWMTDG